MVAGGQDTLINVFTLGSDKTEPAYTLVGHRENVCALNATPSGVIISGSWDKCVHSRVIRSYSCITPHDAFYRTARVWVKFSQAYELAGHQQAVWAVVAVNDTQFLTGND